MFCFFNLYARQCQHCDNKVGLGLFVFEFLIKVLYLLVIVFVV